LLTNRTEILSKGRGQWASEAGDQTRESPPLCMTPDN
jgi:hypothetical protein